MPYSLKVQNASRNSSQWVSAERAEELSWSCKPSNSHMAETLGNQIARSAVELACLTTTLAVAVLTAVALVLVDEDDIVSSSSSPRSLILAADSVHSNVYG